MDPSYRSRSDASGRNGPGMPRRRERRVERLMEVSPARLISQTERHFHRLSLRRAHPTSGSCSLRHVPVGSR
jgi:hypothetical protein